MSDGKQADNVIFSNIYEWLNQILNIYANIKYEYNVYEFER